MRDDDQEQFGLTRQHSSKDNESQTVLGNSSEGKVLPFRKHTARPEPTFVRQTGGQRLKKNKSLDYGNLRTQKAPFRRVQDRVQGQAWHLKIIYTVLFLAAVVLALKNCGKF
jgi:hypothetical protein